MLKYYFGATRFSIVSPDSTSWRLSRKEGVADAQNYTERLFSDERLGPRVQIFCELAAPIYQQMADRHHYRHFVYYSPQLPDKWLTELQAAAEKYPVLELVAVNSDRVGNVARMQKVLVEAAPGDDALVFAFRVDDDDLLSADYLDQVEQYMLPEHDGFGVSLAEGYVGLFEHGGYSVLRHYNQAMSSMGQGAIGRWISSTGTLEINEIRNHRRTPKMRTVLLNAQRPSVIQTRHIQQDTATDDGHMNGDPDVIRREILTKMGRHAVVEDTEQLFTQFPTLRGLYTAAEDAKVSADAEQAASDAKAAEAGNAAAGVGRASVGQSATSRLAVARRRLRRRVGTMARRIGLRR
ncbi:glycosyltransferase [Citricoccus parietis]|uniref:Glycosyltransferase n=1 Tax=Citricoccus parietis TaxID=592307 RepID=A0ABV6F150_9MICC